MSALVLIPDKIRRLIPMLGSGADHEALAAARAIGRILNKEGLGFTDLAAAIPAVESVHLVDTSGACPPPFDVYAWKRAYTPMQEREHRARVRFCQSRLHRLTPWERDFINSVARLHGNLSIRQSDRLAVIVDRIEWEARHAC